MVWNEIHVTYSVGSKVPVLPKVDVTVDVLLNQEGIMWNDNYVLDDPRYRTF